MTVATKSQADNLIAAVKLKNEISKLKTAGKDTTHEEARLKVFTKPVITKVDGQGRTN